MRKKIFGFSLFISLFILILLFLSNLNLRAIAAPLKEADLGKQTEFVADEVVVKFKTRVTSSQIEQFNQNFKTSRTRTRLFADFVTLRVPAGSDTKTFVKKIKTDPRVEYAEPNYLAHALMVPNDYYYSYQWNLDNPVYGGIHAEPAWDISSGSGVVVAIIDTGIAYENYGRSYQRAPDLAGTCFVAGYDFVNNDSHPNDDNSHGTHVAGTVAQTTNNNAGVAGLAYSSCLMSVKVLNKQGSGTYADIAEGIRFAADSGAKVINLSLGGSADAEALRQAVAYAYGKGVTIVAAAGNYSSSAALYPAAYDESVIAVGATRYDETLAYYSNFGPSVDLVAPGGDLTVDQNGDGYKDGILQNTFNPNTQNPKDFSYWFFQGTSMASPHVAGVAAMVIAKGVVGPAEVRAALESSAEDLGNPGRDDTFGWGLVDAAAALGVTPIPTPSSSPTPTLFLTPSPTATPSPSPSPSPTPTPTSSPTSTPTPTLSPSPTPSPTPTPSPGPTPEVKCWSGDYQYLYRNSSQARKFCKCTQGSYGYRSYRSVSGQKTAYSYINSGDNENWEVTSGSLSRPVYEVTCSDRKAYPTNQDYYYP